MTQILQQDVMKQKEIITKESKAPEVVEIQLP